MFARIFSLQTLCAIALVAGIVAGWANTGWWCKGWGLFLYAWALAAMAFGARRRSWPVLAALLGVALAWRCHRLDTQARRELLYPGRLVEMSLSVDGTGPVRHNRDSTRYHVTVDSHVEGVRIRAKIPLASPSSPLPKPGERWRIKARSYPVKRYGKNAVGLTPVRNSTPRRESGDETFSDFLKRFYASAKMDLSENCGVGLGDHPRLAAMNRAILLGERSAMTREERDAFASSGTIHIFAVSGLHVMIAAFLAQAFLRVFVRDERWRAALLLPLLFVYVALTGMRPSAVRAFVMVALYFGADVFRRQRSAAPALAITVLLMYAWNPRLVFSVGATFSFAVMASISFAIEAMRGVEFLPGRERHLVRGVAGSFGIGAVAWAGGVPIAAATFGFVSPAALIAGPVVVTLTGYQMMFGAAGMLAAGILPPAGAALNNIAAFFMNMMAGISKWAAKLPGGRIETGAFPWWAALLWYVALAGAILLTRAWLVKIAKAREKIGIV